MSPIDVAIIAFCLAIGGVLKGATGAGAPLLAVPAISAIYDVRLAVVTMLLPTIVTNAWQLVAYRRSFTGLPFLAPFVTAALVGVVMGSFMLVGLPITALTGVLAAALTVYVIFRMLKPHWALSPQAAKRLALPAGWISGLLQGASGLSAPASLPYLNALGIQRPQFVVSVSTLFLMFGSVQTLALFGLGQLRADWLMLSAAAILPVFAGMTFGNWLGARMDPQVFGRIVLVVLTGLAIKLSYDVLSPLLSGAGG
ncbi:MAG: sulfite exporter TauE/SafE family protein [Devosia sp.]